MTIVQIFAILSLLIAFGVPQKTVDEVHAILIPPIASTTPVVIVPVIQTPIIENAPVYFGGTNPAPIPTPVNEIPIVKRLEIKKATGGGQLNVDEFNSGCEVYYSENGVEIEGVPITVTTNSNGWFNTGTATFPTITVKTRRPNGGTSRPSADVDYRTKTKGIHTLTFTVNGISGTCDVNYFSKLIK